MVSLDNPFGDGRAAERITAALGRWASGRSPLLEPAEEFLPAEFLPAEFLPAEFLPAEFLPARTALAR
jgi:hypothetical protein